MKEVLAGMSIRARMAYTKKASARYIAHLDLARLFQRAFRRAAVEIVYSEGFNPHPRISFGAPLPVGMEGEREYVDVILKELRLEDLQRAFAQLSAQMPLGIELLSWQIIPDRGPKLMALLDTAVYQAEVPWESGPEEAIGEGEASAGGGVAAIDAKVVFEQALHKWLQQPEILWGRKKEDRMLTVNLRPFIRMVAVTEVLSGRQKVIFEIVTVLGNAGSVRPLEILGAFKRDSGLLLALGEARVKRSGVYWVDAFGVRRRPDE